MPFSERSHSIAPGEIITKRKLEEYERLLRFQHELLEGQTVLNFGCGGSNINKELQELGIDTSIINLDIKFNPAGSTFPDRLRYMLRKPVPTRMFESRRTFIQGDGKHLPFRADAFDTTLALWSTYQAETATDKESIFRELMRVSKVIHLYPVFGEAFDILKKLCKEHEFKIVTSQPLHMHERLQARLQGHNLEPFTAQTPDDYTNYIQEHEEKDRIVEPKRQVPIINKTLLPEALDLGGNLVILAKLD